MEDSSHLPRRLSEIRTFAANSSASLNPDLACDGCPTTDTRVEVQDTTATPWDAIGLLDRADANSISKWATTLSLRGLSVRGLGHMTSSVGTPADPRCHLQQIKHCSFVHWSELALPVL